MICPVLFLNLFHWPREGCSKVSKRGEPNLWNSSFSGRGCWFCPSLWRSFRVWWTDDQKYPKNHFLWIKQHHFQTCGIVLILAVSFYWSRNSTMSLAHKPFSVDSSYGAMLQFEDPVRKKAAGYLVDGFRHRYPVVSLNTYILQHSAPPPPTLLSPFLSPF